MGLRGPAKKPIALERAEGFPGHRNATGHEVEFAEGEPEMPAGLNAAAKRIWRDTVPMLMSVPGLLSVADGSALGDYCKTSADLLECERSMRVLQSRQARILLTKAKEQKQTLSRQEAKASANAGVLKQFGQPLNALRHRLNVLRRELGLSASARSSIRLTGGERPNTDPLDSAFSGKTSRLVAV